MSRSDWPRAAWDAINRLAELDLEHYPKHVHHREAFLGKARAQRALQHETLIDSLLRDNPAVSSEQIVLACNPKPVSQDPESARRRDYDRVRSTCTTCSGTWWVPIDAAAKWWVRCPDCHPQREGAKNG